MIHFTVVLSSFSKYCIVVVFCSVLYCWRFMCRSIYVQILLWILFLSTAWFLPLVYFLVLFEFSRVVLTKWWPGRGKVFEWLILGSLPNLILYLLAATLGLFCLRSKTGSCFFYLGFGSAKLPLILWPQMIHSLLCSVERFLLHQTAVFPKCCLNFLHLSLYFWDPTLLESRKKIVTVISGDPCSIMEYESMEQTKQQFLYLEQSPPCL